MADASPIRGPAAPAAAGGMTARRRLFLLAFRVRMMLFYPLLLLFLAVLLLLGPLLGEPARRWLRFRVPRRLAAWFLAVNRIDLQVEGLERLHAFASGPLVIVCNHGSRFDAYLLMATLPRAYKSFWSNEAHITQEGFGLLAFCGRVCDMYFEHDKTDRRRTLAEFRRAEVHVRGGGVLSLFPEGSVSPDGQVGHFGSAPLKLALRCGAPLLPVVLLGTRSTFETRWRQRGRRCRVVMRVLEPVDTRGLDARALPTLQSHLESTMSRHVAEHELASRAAP